MSTLPEAHVEIVAAEFGLSWDAHVVITTDDGEVRARLPLTKVEVVADAASALPCYTLSTVRCNIALPTADRVSRAIAAGSVTRKRPHGGH